MAEHARPGFHPSPVDASFRRGGYHVHAAGPDTLVRLLLEVQIQYPAASGSVATLVNDLYSWPVEYLSEINRILDPQDLLREVPPR